jgi:hypothetical protein
MQEIIDMSGLKSRMLCLARMNSYWLDGKGRRLWIAERNICSGNINDVHLSDEYPIYFQIQS